MRHHQVGVLHQQDVFRFIADQSVVEQQVEIAELRLVGRRFREPDLAGGMLVPKAAQHGRQDHIGHALQGADVDSTIARLESINRMSQRLGSRQQLPALLEYHGSKRSSPHRPRATGPIKHRAANSPLQRCDVLAHARLGVAQPVRRSGERPLLGDRDHRRQLPQIDIGHGPNV
jgi:hypothetical protein